MEIYVVLIDSGKSLVGRTEVSYLREQGVDDIVVMIASYDASDHICDSALSSQFL